ncbi:MAG: aspartate-semialdehyde dehydrogenase, partial [Chloroflexi bacterium]|nr:aspartate-semialdehyde dehydrogenase [Chloroflexota bacterium]
MKHKELLQKIPVAILGATGAVGQRFVQLLENHPWFEITAITGSQRTSGGKYGQVCQWVLDGDPPASICDMVVQDSEPNLPVKLVFSALPNKLAYDVELNFARSGYFVCSNASAHRQEPDVPLIIPEVNANHVAMIASQRAQQNWRGLIITSPNCTTSGLAMTLKPLDQAFGLRQVMVTTMQAVSGAGYPGVSYMDIAGNIIPYISGEEEKIKQETCILLGSVQGNRRVQAKIDISVQANRVSVMDGHTLSIAMKFDRKPTPEESTQALVEFRVPKDVSGLPSAPVRTIYVRKQLSRPQPRRDCNMDSGMA